MYEIISKTIYKIFIRSFFYHDITISIPFLSNFEQKSKWNNFIFYADKTGKALSLIAFKISIGAIPVR